MPSCVLVGNYGVGNIGDEALREYFLTAFPEVEWTVVSAHPSAKNEVPRLPFGLRSLFGAWPKTIVAIRNADAVVFGGGSLFTDIESVSACIMWRSYAVFARFFGTPIIMAFQGVGPFRTRLGERLARKTFLSASFMSVRDAVSRERVEAWKCAVPVLEGFDPAFALFSRHPVSVAGESSLVLIPRGNSDDAFFVAASREIVKSWQRIEVLLLEPSSAERLVAEKLKAMTHSKAAIIEVRSVSQLLSEVAKAATVVTQRYHGALAALAMKKDVIICPQQQGDKLDALRAVQTDASSHQRWMLAISAGEEALHRHLTQL